MGLKVEPDCIEMIYTYQLANKQPYDYHLLYLVLLDRLPP
jgi:hypothetical protein